MDKILVISLCTGGMMRDQFIEYCQSWNKKRDFYLYCITNDDVSNEYVQSDGMLNLRFKRKEPWTYISPLKILKIKRYIKKINPDLIFLFTPHPTNIFLFSILKKFPLLTQVHDPVPHSGNSLLDRLILKWQLKLCYKFSNVISVAGEALKKQIVDSFKVNENKIEVIPLALLPSRMFERKAELNCDIDILFYGRIEYYKGLDIFVESLKLIDKKLRIVIAGKGKPYFEIENCESNITFINKYLSNEEIAGLIERSKVIILPYRDASGTMVISEIFYFGKPIICTDVGVFKEYAHDCGLVVKPNSSDELASAINYFFSNSKIKEKMSKKTKFYVETFFNIDTVCGDYIKLFSKILEEKR